MSKELIQIIKDNKPEDEIISYLSAKTYNKKDINMWDSMGNTILTLLASRGMAGAVKKALEFKPKINVTNVHGSSAILWASVDANYEIIKILIDNGANYNLDRNSFMPTGDGNKIKAPITAMIDCVQYKHKSTLWMNKALKCADLFLDLVKDRNQANRFLRQIKEVEQKDNELYQKMAYGLALLKEKYDLEHKLEKKNFNVSFNSSKKI